MEDRWTSGNKNHRGVDEDDRIRKTFIARFESYAGAIRDAILRFRTMAERNASAFESIAESNRTLLKQVNELEQQAKNLTLQVSENQKTLSVEQMIFKKKRSGKSITPGNAKRGRSQGLF